MEVLAQWKQGIIYPRWAALAHSGYGEARFIFYPPISWLLGALLGALLPWKLAPAAFVFVALTLSGCSMFLLARRYLARPDAIFAAALYAANPYYIVPAAYEQKWVAIAQVLAPGVRPQDNFLFTILEDIDHNRFNFLVSLVAAAQIVMLAGTALLSRLRRRESSQLWWTLAAWSLFCTLLMFSFTFFLWQHLPKLRFVQLPWRWLLCLNVPFALLTTMAWRRWAARALVCAAMLFVLVVTWHRVQPPWWDTSADINEMHDNQQDGSGYEGTDEYVPTGADPYEINKEARRVTFDGAGHSRIEVKQWDAESKFFIADVTSPGKLVVRLFDYPAWHVEVNGHPVAPETREITGQFMIPVEAGQNQVRITFIRTWDRTAGGIISALTAVFVLIVGFFMRSTSLNT